MTAPNIKRDFFISYNKADRSWAEWVAWELEEKNYTTLLQEWDFRPGQSFVLRMNQAIQQANRTIAILSPDYLNANYTQPEWGAAFAKDPTGDNGLLVPVRVRECDLQGLLSQIIYIDLVGLEEQAAKETLLAGMHRDRAKPKRKPTFPDTIPRSVAVRPTFPGEIVRSSYSRWLLLIPIVIFITLLVFLFKDKLVKEKPGLQQPTTANAAPPFSGEQKYQLSVARWIGYAPFYIASAKGWMPHWKVFDRANMTVEERANHINSKKDHAFVSTFDNFYNDIAVGSQYNVNATVILVLAKSDGGDAIVAKKSIHKVKDLKGKVVGAWIGSSSHLFLAAELSAAKMEFSEIDLKGIPRPEQLVEAFRRGELDAIAIYSPYLEQAESYGHVLRSSAGPKDSLIFDGLFLHDRSDIQIDKNSLLELFNAWDKGVQFLRQENPESFSELASVLGVSVQQAQQAYFRVKLFTVSENSTRVDEWSTIAERVRKSSERAGLWHLGTKPVIHIDKTYVKEYLDK